MLAHHLAQQDKGSGIAMICTFGDVTDVVWWRELDLPNRTVIGPDGRLIAEAPAAIETDAAKAAYAELAGKTVFSAKARIVELLTESGDLTGDPKKITHAVKFFEKGDRPLEIISTRQWYIRNGARDEELRSTLLERGQQIGFVPEHMRVRYENWVGGLTGDWLISRQRFFGVPIPVWYELDADGAKGAVIVPSEDSLPVDPSSDTAPGYDESQRGVPGGFAGEIDIMDTWATSSLTPQIAGGWESDPELFDSGLPVLPAQPGPGHHPHLAVLHRAAIRSSSTASHPGAPQGSPASSSTPTARRCRSRRATWSRQRPCSTSTAPTRCGTGRRPADSARMPRSTRRTRSRSRSAGASRSRCSTPRSSCTPSRCRRVRMTRPP